MIRVSVIVPCRNEERTVFALLTRVARVDLSGMGVEKEILVVDDGSTDGSRGEVERFAGSRPDANVRLLTVNPGRGKGHAVRRALEAATGQIALIQDADLEYDPADYPELLAPIVAGRTRVVYGSRRLRSPMPMSGPLFALGGLLENELLHLLYRTTVTDIATGYKVLRMDLLRELALEADGFEFCPEVTAKLLNRGETIAEVPVRYAPRKKRDGKKIRWPDFFAAVWTLLRVRFRKRA